MGIYNTISSICLLKSLNSMILSEHTWFIQILQKGPGEGIDSGIYTTILSICSSKSFTNMILRNKHRSFNFFKKVRDKGLTGGFTLQFCPFAL